MLFDLCFGWAHLNNLRLLLEAFSASLTRLLSLLIFSWYHIYYIFRTTTQISFITCVHLRVDVARQTNQRSLSLLLPLSNMLKILIQGDWSTQTHMYLYILGIVTSAVHTKVRSLSVIFCAFIGNIFSKLLFHSVKIYRIHEVLQLTGYKSRKNTKVHAYFIPMSVVFFYQRYVRVV